MVIQLGLLFSALLLRPCVGAIPQSTLPLVEGFPGQPSPWLPIDWRVLANDSVSFMFNEATSGPYLPLFWSDNSSGVVGAFGLPSYVGQTTGAGGSPESIACAAAVLSASLIGRNVSCMSGGGLSCVDVERGLLQYLDANVSGIFTDRPGQRNGSFWYEAWVSMVPVMVASASRSGALSPALRESAQAWLRVEGALGAPLPSFNYTGVSFSDDGTPIPVAGNDRDYPLPVTAAGVAWLLYVTRAALGETDPDAPALLAGAEQALQYLFSVPYNCYWEVLLPHGALLSSRLNAETGSSYNTSALLNDIFEDDLPSHYPFRWGWGTIAQSWAGVDVYGLTGAVSDRGGYAFAMDTMATIAALLPVARYEAQYARALGRYAMNAVNAARLFFPRFNAFDQQSDAAWVAAASSGADAMAYEGLRRWGFNETDGNITGPYATGDGKSQDDLPTNIAVYGGAYVGLLAAVVVYLENAPTGLGAFSLTATDWFSRPSYSTTLVYNGAGAPVNVSFPLPPTGGLFDVYDAVSQAIVASNVAPPTLSISINGDTAVVLVVFPAGATITRDEEHNWLLANGIVIDWSLQ